MKTVKEAPFGFVPRPGCDTMYPDRDIEHAVLAPNPNPSPDMGLTDVGLGELIIMALTHGVLDDDWRLIDSAFILRSARNSRSWPLPLRTGTRLSMTLTQGFSS